MYGRLYFFNVINLFKMDHVDLFFIYSKLHEAYEDFKQQAQYLISMCSYTLEEEDWHDFTMYMNGLSVCAFINILVITLIGFFFPVYLKNARLTKCPFAETTIKKRAFFLKKCRNGQNQNDNFLKKTTIITKTTIFKRAFFSENI